MAGGNLHMSKWFETFYLRRLIGGQEQVGDDAHIFAQVWNLALGPSAVGSIVYRAILCTACNPNNANGTDYTSLPAGNGYPNPSNLDNMPHVRLGIDGLVKHKATNIAPISFGPATANWSPVTHLVIVGQRYGYSWTHATKIRFWFQFTPAVQINSGQTFVIPVGSLSLQVV